ncbi:MAG: amino acid ABC transporter permease [bacterium]
MQEYIQTLTGIFWQLIRDGVRMTLYLTVDAYLLALGIGLIAALAAVSRNSIPWLRFLFRRGSALYVDVIRGIPLLVQIIYAYYVIFPTLERLRIIPQIPLFLTAVISVGVCYGAYLAEIIRAGIESIHRGQMEAARSLGMTYLQAMRYVILPQAARRILPPLGNEFIAMLKDTSIVSVIAMRELTRAGREIITVNFMTIEVWTMVAFLYLVITTAFSYILRRAERRMGISD